MTPAYLSIEKKFQNLAIVMCHLFLGGNFRQIFLIHEPKIVDFRLMQEVNFQCPNVSWIVSDLHRPMPYELHVDHNGYDTLQLFVIEQRQYIEEIKLVQSFGAYYSIFIFDSNFPTTFVQAETRVTIRNSLAIVHNITSDSVHLSSLIGGRSATSTIHFNGSEVDAVTPDAAFDMTFGERERLRELGIFLIESFCYDRKNRKVDGNYYHNYFLANFFFRQMNMTVLKTVRYNCDPTPSDEPFFTFRRIPQPIYDEISFDSTYVRVNNRPFTDELKRLTVIFLDPLSLKVYANQYRSFRLLKPATVSIHAQFKNKVFLEFIYGDDFNRSSAERVILMILRNAMVFCVLMIVSVVVLYLIRWKANLRKDGIVSVFFDVLIAVIGGGNLRYNHKWERAFFVILLFGSFLLNTICVDNFLFYTFSFGKENRMDSLEKLAELRTPIKNGDHNLVEARNSVEHMIRTKLDRKVNLTDKVNETKSRAFVVADSTSQNKGLRYEREMFFLGEVDVAVYLTVHDMLPERLAVTFVQLVQSLMENGLHKFYSSYAKFLKEIRKTNVRTVMPPDAFETITIDQIFFYLLMYSSCSMVALVTFVVELIVDYFNKKSC